MLKSDYIIEEIFNIHNYPDDYENVDILDFINEIIDEAKHNSKFANNLKSSLADKRLELSYCPNCGDELIDGEFKEYHNELNEYGETPYETLSFKYCENCGWNKDNNEE